MLKLIPVTEEHTDFILGLNNDEVFSKSFPRQTKITKEQHLSFLKKINDKGDKYYVVNCEGKNIGTVSIYDIDFTHSKAEWGRFIIYPEYGSLAFLVSKMIIKEAFEVLNLNKLYCTILETNTKVIKLNKLLKFQVEGILKDHYFLNGKFVGLYCLALFKKDYLR